MIFKLKLDRGNLLYVNTDNIVTLESYYDEKARRDLKVDILHIVEINGLSYVIDHVKVSDTVESKYPLHKHFKESTAKFQELLEVLDGQTKDNRKDTESA